MKTRNSWILVLAAFFCGALFCTQASAKVCFVGEEECGSGASFEPAEELPNEDLCRQEKYDTLASACANPGGVCPYDARYVRCCPSEYAYQACVYPLETVKKIVDGKTTVDRCGSLYKCQCPSEYGVTSDYAKTNNCQPGGGYCMLNDGTTDQVKYKTCSCDTSVYTDATKCSNNQTEEASCTDEKGKVRKKCYCNRSRFPYAACEYGSKGIICIDSNINREYYQQCKTARERCLEENFIAENVTQCPQGSRDCTSTVSSKKYYCALGDGCPYPVVPQLYKCQFDKGRWCKANGYTQESSTPVSRNASCIDAATGLEGKAEPCTENTKTPTYYYRCKLTCSQRAQLGVTRNNDLVQDSGLANAGIKAYYNVMGADKHLYVADGGVVPTNNQTEWKNIGSKIDFASINGIFALCDRSQTDYMECCEERSQYYNRPELKFDGLAINKSNYFLSKNMSDINVNIYASNDDPDKGGFGETYIVNADHTWNNVTITNDVKPANSSITDGGSEKYWRIDNRKNDIVIKGGKTLTFTGLTEFDFSTYWWHTDSNNTKYAMDQYEPSRKATFYTTHFRAEGNAKIKFKGAEIIGSGASWDGDSATMLFIDTNMDSSWDDLGHIWSYWNIGLKNSSINVSLFRIGGWQGSTYSFPSYIDTAAPTDGEQHARYRCHGAYLTSYSTLNITDYYGLLHNSYSKIYVSYSSTLKSAKPIQLKGSNSDIICLQSGAKATINGKSLNATSGNKMIYGWNTKNTYVAGSPSALVSTTSQEWYNRFKNCDSNGKNCSWPSNPICSSSGWYTDNGDGHNVAYYPNKTGSILCTACHSCSWYGMGFN